LPHQAEWLQPYETSGLIRIGSQHDGGYVVPDSKIEELDSLISFGIGRNWEFETSLKARSPKITIHGYDYSVSERMFYREARSALLNCLFLQKNISGLREKIRIYQSFKQTFSGNNTHFRQNIGIRENGKDTVGLNIAFQRLKKSKNIAVKMDIEGFEYHILSDLLLFEKKILILIIEFHYTGVFRETFQRIITQLQKKFYLAHFHANNAGDLAADGIPEFMELTFIRGQPPTKKKIKTLPLPGIDQANDPKKRDFIFMWP